MAQPNKSVGLRKGRPRRAALYERLHIQIGELRERPSLRRSLIVRTETARRLTRST
jgi:hypothetical protein